jgi:hypothetical protein
LSIYLRIVALLFCVVNAISQQTAIVKACEIAEIKPKFEKRNLNGPAAVAAQIKCLARSNKSCTEGKATNRSDAPLLI